MREQLFVLTETETVDVVESQKEGRLVIALSTRKFKEYKEVNMDGELLRQIAEVRIATTDQILSGEATEEDREIHQAAGAALVRLLGTRIVEVESQKDKI